MKLVTLVAEALSLVSIGGCLCDGSFHHLVSRTLIALISRPAVSVALIALISYLTPIQRSVVPPVRWCLGVVRRWPMGDGVDVPEIVVGLHHPVNTVWPAASWFPGL